ncbi:MAG: VWA domain-containing protein [Pyrinomonadaceae bacterium]
MIKNFWPGIAIFLASTVAIFSQNPVPKPQLTPPPDDTDVVKISTNLIQIDVSVLDSKGKAVTDLKPEEIEIFENGQKQKITNFSFISSIRASTENAPAADKNAIPIPQAMLRTDQIRRTFALVVDDLSLSFESAYQTKRALKKFVDEQMQPGDLVAIIRTGAGTGALQQFTSDKRMLYAAIDKVKWNPLGSGGVSAFAPIEATPDTSLRSTSDDDQSTDDVSKAIESGQQGLEDFRSSVFATGTLGALRYIVTGMSEFPGRKSVILFSDGFKLFEKDSDGFQESGRVLDFLRQLVDTANRSSVVFYTVDARGLVYTGFTAADNISDTSPDAMNSEATKRSDQLLDTQEGLSYLAEETGGFVVKNNNDLSGGIRRVLDDQSYYLIAYEPDAETFDPLKRKFNKLLVKVSRSGAKVRYRSGFFNVAERDKPAASVGQTPVQQLETALLSPFAVSGINLRLNALFGNEAKSGSFVRSLLHIGAGDLKFTDDKDGRKKAVFDVLAMSFGDNGQTVDQIGRTYTLSVKADTFKKISADGFVYHFAFPVKKAGAYQYRVAIRDVQSGNVGSASQFIEVPDVKKNRLTLSSIVLENLTNDEWLKLENASAPPAPTDPMADTALRRAKKGSVMRYGYEIYNAKLSPEKAPSLQTKIRVFRDGKLILDGAQKPIELMGQSDLAHLRAAGALAIGAKMAPGDYILQIIVIDTLAKTKQQIATQFVQFEVVE